MPTLAATSDGSRMDGCGITRAVPFSIRAKQPVVLQSPRDKPDQYAALARRARPVVQGTLVPPDPHAASTGPSTATNPSLTSNLQGSEGCDSHLNAA